MDTPWSPLDALPEAVLVTVDGKVRWANAAASRLLDTTSGALVGSDVSRWLVEGELQRMLTLEAQRREGWAVGEGLRVRFVQRPSGREVQAEVRLGSRGNELVISARDATESRAAEELMAQLANLSVQAGGMLGLDALVAGSSPIFAALGWVVTLTEVRGERAQVTHVSGRADGSPVAQYGRSLLGREAALDDYPVVATVVRTGRPLFLDDAPARQPGPVHSAAALSASMDRGRTRNASAWVLVPHDDGVAHVLTVAGNSLNEHDFVAVQLFAAQLAAARRLERLRGELVRRERLAAVGEMSAVLAHEVRNPLAVIFNTLVQLQRVQRPEADGLIAIAQEEAERLRRLVEELLEFARPRAASLEPVELEPLLRDALDAARQDPGCQRRDFEVRLEVAPALPRAFVDRGLLRRALVNVVVNAIQHVRPGGALRLGLDRPNPAVLRVRVANDGAPLPPALAERVFEPFFTTRATGTGLGLAVVKQIVESLGGRIELEPSTAGTCFALFVPVEPPARPSL